MGGWLRQNIATVIVGAVLLAIIVCIAVYLIRKRKKGGCSCGCSGCPMSGNCHAEKRPDQKEKP